MKNNLKKEGQQSGSGHATQQQGGSQQQRVRAQPGTGQQQQVQRQGSGQQQGWGQQQRVGSQHGGVQQQIHVQQKGAVQQQRGCQQQGGVPQQQVRSHQEGLQQQRSQHGAWGQQGGCQKEQLHLSTSEQQRSGGQRTAPQGQHSQRGWGQLDSGPQPQGPKSQSQGQQRPSQQQTQQMPSQHKTQQSAPHGKLPGSQQQHRAPQQTDRSVSSQSSQRPSPSGSTKSATFSKSVSQAQVIGSQQECSSQQANQTGSSQSSQKSSYSPSTSSATSSRSGVVRGTAGRKEIVETNYLRLNLDKMPSTAYHYDVSITPDRPKKFFRQAFEQFNRECFRNIGIAFDGVKSCYTVELLPIGKELTKEVKVDDSKGKTLTYNITVKATDNIEVDLSKLRTYFQERIWDKPMRELQCLEVVLASPCHNAGVRAGRSFFTKPDTTYDLRDGYELWIGLYQAMILGEEPFLNIDIAHKSFPTASTILDYLNKNVRDFDPSRQLEPRARYSLIDFLKGLRITYAAPGSLKKDYNFLDVSEDSASNRTFLHAESGNRMKISDYFAKERKTRLKYPNLNCILVGSTVKPIALPIEFCAISGGQAIKKKDGQNQIQQMIRYAATSTDQRKKKIMMLLQKFNHNNNNLIRSFGIQITPQFIDVPLRVLNPPAIEYFNREIQRVNNGSWRMFPKTKFLETTRKTHKWAVIYSKQSRNINFHVVENKLVKLLKGAASAANVDLDPKPIIDSFDRIDAKLQQLKREKFDLVIVVIPFRGDTYAKIKQSAELHHGILTQCIKEETVERRSNMQLAVNLMLKINAKLNGTNHKIESHSNSNIPLKDVMFLGADVTHPSPDQKNIPSVVGVAASHDPNAACYNMQYRLQQSTLEEIEDMASIIKEHLGVYFKKQGRYPQHIIYYRDGVSDGQFEKVRKIELQSIRNGCTQLRLQPLPKITCIVAVKRHHTRFFPKTQNARDKFNNVEPGSVVDQVITHPSEVQFFMVSHQSIQGTAKPTRYNVIQDDAKMNIDHIQLLTHNLCHLFPRCNRAVSYPTPVYLAHLVAARGRVYLEGTQRFGNLKEEYAKRKIHMDVMKNNPMYFV